MLLASPMGITASVCTPEREREGGGKERGSERESRERRTEKDMDTIIHTLCVQLGPYFLIMVIPLIVHH